MRSLLKWVWILINIGFALLLIGAVFSRVISPLRFWPLSFLGLAFPALAAANIFFLIYWLIRFKKPIFISLIALIIALPALNTSFRLIKKDPAPRETEKPFSILTYNVRLFDVFNWSGKENNGNDLIQFLAQSGADILCLQEFMENNSKTFSHDQLKNRLSEYPYSFIDYNYQAYKRKHGLAIFSKFPVIGGNKGIFPGTRNMFIYADVKINSDTVRIFNAHMESIHLDYQQYNLIDSLNITVNETNWAEVRRIMSNVKQAFNKRVEQVEIIRKEIDTSPYPVIVCGDFNDTPVSFTYKNLKKDLRDSFMESGKGMGTTYQQFLLPLRIDFILHDPDLEAGQHEVINVSFSDHKPVKTSLWINR